MYYALSDILYSRLSGIRFRKSKNAELITNTKRILNLITNDDANFQTR